MNSLEDSNLDEILELKEEGLSVRAIAKQLGMSKSAVDRALQKSRGQA
jgi:IS30 family transposase